MGNLKEFLEEQNILEDFGYYKLQKKKEYQHNYYLTKTKIKRRHKTLPS